MAQQEYDFLIIGSGAAGSSAATALTKKSIRTGMVERGTLGGTCLNYGCDPTKTLIHVDKLLYQARHGNQFGLRVPEANADWGKMMQWVHQVINHLRGGTIEQARDHLEQQGIDVIHGEATFVSAHEVSIGGRVVSAERILIATGSETLIPPIEGLEEAGYITNIEVVSLHSLPRRMAIAGGGALGIEFAQMFHRFGVDVIVLEHSSTILDKEDRELAEKLCQMLTDEGIRLETDAELKRVERVGDGKRLTIKCGKREEEELEVDELLMAVGRKAAFEALHLEKAGVKTSEKGVIVDATLRTNVPHIWAAGDVASKYQFTHVASAQGHLAAHNAFSEHPQAFDDRVIPWVTFTNPPLAHVGKTEEELREEGTEYRVACMPFSENERAIMVGETEGLLKLLVDAKGNIVGGHILGEGADDLLAPIVLAMHANMPVEKLASVILPYPTMSESLSQAVKKL